MLHQAANGGWTRAYAYEATSLIEDGAGLTPRKTSNRLSRTTLHPDGASPLVEPYAHDAHGNMTRHATPAADAVGLRGPAERDLETGDDPLHA